MALKPLQKEQIATMFLIDHKMLQNIFCNILFSFSSSHKLIAFNLII